MSVKAAPRHRRERARGASATGGAHGNERLTAMTGAVLLVLLAAEGVTIVFKRELLTLHFFIGMLLIGPVLLKVGSTGYRFVRYYSGSAPYVRKGPPALLLRLLGPVVIATSAGVIGSGVALAITGPRYPQWIFIHKATFILWFGATAVHVLWYAPRLPRLLRAGSPARGRVSAVTRRSRPTLAAPGLRSRDRPGGRPCDVPPGRFLDRPGA